MIIFPRVRIPESFKINAPPGSILAGQKKGWVTRDLYLEWFKFFIQQIPPARPVLLIQDGHSSHISLELIEVARKNDIHLLCLPAHTTHVLQPLDVGVFSSFKHNVGLALKAMVRSSAGRVPTTDDISFIVSEAWPKSLTPINLMSGFRKTGIHPLNPGCIKDRETAPCLACDHDPVTSTSDADTSGSLNSLETRAPESDSHSHESGSVDSISSAMDTLLIQPHITRKSKRKAKPGYNSSAVCITNASFIQKLSEEQKKKRQKKATKECPKKGKLDKKERNDLRKQMDKRGGKSYKKATGKAAVVLTEKKLLIVEKYLMDEVK